LFILEAKLSEVPFEDIVDIVRYAGCHACETYTYTLPCSLDVDFEDFLVGLGKLKYPLARFKMIRMDNDFIRLTSRVGRNWLEIKFKKEREEKQPLFNVQLAAYVEAKNMITIKI
jgi:hypothetical protein